MSSRRKRAHRWPALRRRGSGLTLIELMVALAVFAVLGTLTYRGANEMFASNQHITAELERWRELVRAFQIVDSELLQIVAVQSANTPTTDTTPAIHVTSQPPSLSFVSLAGGRHPERVTFRLNQDRLEWERSPVEKAGEAERDTLIAGVEAARWRFLSDSGWSESWPNANATRNTIPAAIGLELDVTGIGQVNRIYALR